MMLIRRTVLILALITTSGCMHWKQLRPLPRVEQGPVALRSARLTTAPAATPIRIPTLVVLRDVRITADSVIGWRQEAPDRVAVPRSEVRGLETRTIDGWRTGGVAAVVVLVAYAAAAWYALAHVRI